MVAMNWADPQTARHDWQRHARLASQAHHPFHRCMSKYAESYEALLACELTRAWELANETSELAERSGSSACTTAVAGLFAHILREQGELENFVPYMDDRSASSSDEELRWKPALLYVVAEVGLQERASALLDDLDSVLALLESGVFPRSANEWQMSRATFMWTMMADAVTRLGRAEHARRLFAVLKPYKGRNAFGPGITLHFGPIDLRLGTLSLLLEQPDDAVGHLEDAVALSLRSDTPLWTVHCQAALVNALGRREASGDRERALRLAEETRRDYENHGMSHFVERMQIT